MVYLHSTFKLYLLLKALLPCHVSFSQTFRLLALQINLKNKCVDVLFSRTMIIGRCFVLKFETSAAISQKFYRFGDHLKSNASIMII